MFEKNTKAGTKMGKLQLKDTKNEYESLIKELKELKIQYSAYFIEMAEIKKKYKNLFK